MVESEASPKWVKSVGSKAKRSSKRALYAGNRAAHKGSKYLREVAKEDDPFIGVIANFIEKNHARQFRGFTAGMRKKPVTTAIKSVPFAVGEASPVPGTGVLAQSITNKLVKILKGLLTKHGEENMDNELRSLLIAKVAEQLKSASTDKEALWEKVTEIAGKASKAMKPIASKAGAFIRKNPLTSTGIAAGGAGAAFGIGRMSKGNR